MNPMPSSIAYWRTEHASFANLLTLLERKLAPLQSGGRPDYETMLDILQYLRHFPDRYHHPREDVAFERLARLDGALVPLLDRLRQEHRSIAAAGERLESLLGAAANDAIVGRETIESAALDYLAAYRNHIANEELVVLPRAGALLTPDDWAAVSRAVPQVSDPLFGDQADERYRELRRQIANEAI